MRKLLDNIVQAAREELSEEEIQARIEGRSGPRDTFIVVNLLMIIVVFIFLAVHFGFSMRDV